MKNTIIHPELVRLVKKIKRLNCIKNINPVATVDALKLARDMHYFRIDWFNNQPA